MPAALVLLAAFHDIVHLKHIPTSRFHALHAHHPQKTQIFTSHTYSDPPLRSGRLDSGVVLFSQDRMVGGVNLRIVQPTLPRAASGHKATVTKRDVIVPSLSEEERAAAVAEGGGGLGLPGPTRRVCLV